MRYSIPSNSLFGQHRQVMQLLCRLQRHPHKRHCTDAGLGFSVGKTVPANPQMRNVMLKHQILTPCKQGLRQAESRVQLNQCQQLVRCSADEQVTLDRLQQFGSDLSHVAFDLALPRYVQTTKRTQAINVKMPE